MKTNAAIQKAGRKPRICFVAHAAYGALAGGKSGHIGGVERQTSLMAKWFAARGYAVSMITWDEDQEDGAEIDGVRVFKVCSQDAGIPGVRFFWPRWSSLNAALKRADADVYYHNCAECVTGQVSLWCRRNCRRFIFSAAHDAQCEAALPGLRTRRERVLYRYGLKHADRVIVQTGRQQETMCEGFRRDVLVLPMPCPGPSDSEYIECLQQRNDPRRVLWIGRVCKQKRPEQFLDLAEACPDVSFGLVGPADRSEYAQRVIARAKMISNVTYHGAASRDCVSEFYKKAKLMCCTSRSEGFPNTFLEAWSYGLPIVSTFDPDNLIRERGIGVSAKDVAEMTSGIRELFGAPQRWQTMSEASRRYYLENHTLESAMPQFERVLLGMPDDAKS
jgi:glycosyltransferase involved in cell wall biosynthesis